MQPHQPIQTPIMLTRRQTLKHSARLSALLAAAGLLPTAAQAAWPAAAFDAKTMAELTKALGAGTPVESKDVVLTGPDIAENGAVVPVAVSTTLPGVRRLLLLVEKNPALLVAMFELTDNVDASFNTRVKMAQSSNVYAVAMLANGKVLYAVKDIKVTLGGCGA